MNVCRGGDGGGDGGGGGGCTVIRRVKKALATHSGPQRVGFSHFASILRARPQNDTVFTLVVTA